MFYCAWKNERKILEKNGNLVIICQRKFDKILRKFMEKLFEMYVNLQEYFLRIWARSTEMLGKSKNKICLNFLIK